MLCWPIWTTIERRDKKPIKMKVIWCFTLMWTHPVFQNVSSKTSNSLLLKLEIPIPTKLQQSELKDSKKYAIKHKNEPKNPKKSSQWKEETPCHCENEWEMKSNSWQMMKIREEPNSADWYAERRRKCVCSVLDW
jgi:hypothetical protein